MGSGGEKYLTFTLNKGVYAINKISVVDIIKVVPINKMTYPFYIKGDMKYLGEKIQVFDLKKILNIIEEENAECNRMLLVNIIINRQKKIIGIQVDSILEEIIIDIDDIKQFPILSSISCIKGVCVISKKIILIIDTNIYISQ